MKKTLCILVSMFCITMQGCSHNNILLQSYDIKKMAVISGIGIEQTQSGMYNVYMQVYVPKEQDNMDINIMYASGRSIAEAVKNISLKYNKQPYLSHNKILILSEDIAKMGIKRHLDYIGRDIEMRESVPVAVCKGNVKNFIAAENEETAKYSGKKANDIIDVSNFNSGVYSVSVLDIYKNFSDDSADLILPYLIREKNDEVEIEGYAVFRGEKMIDSASLNEMQGVFWIKNKIAGNVEVIGNPNNINENISVKIKNSHCTAVPEIINGSLKKVDINIKTEFNVVESGCIDPLDNNQVRQIEEKFNKKIKKRILFVADKYMKNKDTDIFGFKKFDKNADLKNLKLNINIRSNLSGSGLLKNNVE